MNWVQTLASDAKVPATAWRSLLKLPESDFAQPGTVANQPFTTEISTLEKSLLWAEDPLRQGPAHCCLF